MSERVLFRGARLIDPASNHRDRTDVLVEDEEVGGVGPGLSSARAEVIDCDGLVLAPGLVDLHAHLREPGFEHKETVESGSRAAAAGGFTAVCAMPNTDPVADNAAVVIEVRNLADKAGLCDVHPAGAITRGLQGETLTDIAEMAEHGVRLFTDDHNCVQSSRVMRLALEYAKAFEVVIAQHAQDASLSEGWQMHEGYYSSLLGLTGAPGEAESIVVARDLALARLTAGRLHVTHVSAADSVRLLRDGRERGIRVSADVTPHHLALTDGDLIGYDTSLRVNPPLRTSEDRDALRAALADGTLDAVATDHAPHAPEEKEQEFDQSPPGTIGLETALAVVLTELVGPGLIELPAAIERLSLGPARILGLDDQGGPVAPGRPANLVVFDPSTEWTVGDRPFQSQARNSAFTGRRLRGCVLHTMLRGRFTVKEGQPTR
ncbi:MAG: dihydroorotase [Actinobacteria bacterium]|nr:MAG: dihydroorotase [Actinomycetota bacterium]